MSKISGKCSFHLFKYTFLSNVLFNSSKRFMHAWRVDTLRLMRRRERSFDAIPFKERHRNEWANWNFNSEIYAFSKRLNENFDLERLKLAFTHESFVKKLQFQKLELGIAETSFAIEDNKILAKKGDELISTLLKSYLRYFLPRVPEECIRCLDEYLRSDLVLGEIGRRIGCKDLILSSEVNPSDMIISPSVKSLITLLDESQGQKQAMNFIIDFIATYLYNKDIMVIWDIPNPENILSKILSNDGLLPAEVRLLREVGRNTLFACYTVGLYLNKQLIGFSPGESIDIAREMAAYDALRRIFNLTPSKSIFKYGKQAYNLDYLKTNKEHSYIANYRISSFESIENFTKDVKTIEDRT